MKQATMLFKVPGPHETNGNVKYDYVIVDADEVEAYEKKRWSRTLTEAIDKKEAKEAKKAEQKEDGKVSRPVGRPPSSSGDLL